MEFDVPVRFSALAQRVQVVSQAGRAAGLPDAPLNLLVRLRRICEARKTDASALASLAHGLIRWSLDEGGAAVPAHQMVDDLGRDLWLVSKLMHAYEILHCADLSPADQQALSDALAGLLVSLADDLACNEVQWREGMTYLCELLAARPQLAALIEPTGLQRL